MDDAPSPPERDRKRSPEARRRRRSGPQGPQSFAAGLARFQHNLLLAVRDAYREMFGARVDQAKPFTLDLTAQILPGRIWRVEAQPSLEEQVRSSIQEMATRAEVYQPGHVYCYRCDSALCSHSVPPGPAQVFGGYSSTGLPLWPDFPQLLLEMKHPGIDLLYQPAPSGLLAASMDSEMLRHRQLNIFGRQSKTYDILGQVVFGFLVIRPPPGSAREKERVAFSLQAVESRRLDGSVRLELNVLARLSDGHAAFDLLEGPYQLRVYDILVAARERIRSLRCSSGRPGKSYTLARQLEINGSVMEALNRLAAKIEKVGRQQGRRTPHAEDRRVLHRPTPNAREDALAAADDLIFWDEHRHTLVVIGPRNRIHVFSPAGRHITSIVLEADEVRSRLRRRRWTPPAAEQLRAFRLALSGPATPGPATPPPPTR